MKRIILAVALLATPAFSQQQPSDPAFLQAAIVALQKQRNDALDAQAGTQAQLALATEEKAKLATRVKELEAKYEPKPPSDK
jgi:hypothetical protein